MNKLWDVAIIGGGAAGLSAAITLARSRRSIVVIDDHHPRNAPADRVHNYLGRESTSPAELFDIGRDEAAQYGATFLDGRATAVSHADNHFDVSLDGGPVLRARRVLVATGVVDELPDIEGLAERWGRDVLHCVYCHGWEVRDRTIAVLGTGPLAVHHALIFRQLSENVTLVRHNDFPMSIDEAAQLARKNIRIIDGPVSRLQVTQDSLRGVQLETGATIACEALVVATVVSARVDMLAPVRLAPQEMRLGEHLLGTYLPVTRGATAVPGIYAAGNVTDIKAQVITSAAAGTEVAVAINADLAVADAQELQYA
ncbi:NAD(P)/FAD-dependent oxidoreductase [Mycobacteroides abscessus]|uniref:NAD(P)/FAD-dependent oxidoreductase n=1 Tax=Mycobacteroides abscessus TaxID=36809 RepID=UPI00078E2CAB|nr:NAD(P)/FAD-dependent oxidoreductase [Mycobacteroides abscessus]AMU31787.1 thioredoxin reductase [Mycobacteroides abscessus]MDO3028105.1 NAD(P)/FAD-dependent oxidoreductase [Mycobacteroides abscessus subsp. massiliense]PVA57573.1 NAD(P)/FAD-dependent oxidoreductase [Mycobacteroides abscessus]PVA95717.1 NAD(P)/FAD-dependent oxidoreductase [Mycobacteroides abscessus]RIT79178.1 NAD(P)/FAD-dependent oxidoreductase [Mycobacteroides abscessus]